MGQELESFVTKLHGVSSMDDAWATFEAELSKFGIQHSLYCFAPSLPRKSAAAEMLLFESHNPAFIEAYTKEGFLDEEWGTLHCQNSIEPIHWQDQRKLSQLTERQWQGEYLAFDFDLREGLYIPIRGVNRESWGGMGLSATGVKGKEWQDVRGESQNLIEQTAQAFHEFVLSQGYFNTFELSEREQEVLKLITRGMNKHDIADKLNISARTSEVHIYRIRQKLKCINDAQVTAKALIYNLV
jgi:DNA-binding CsgD family transcriptional regulator